ncbi:leucine-rich repeat-containing protein 47-like [Styela clava]|uniref:leucine-rich repeat-containing protein 47-like n=1 Tax=Styela clava TaxID=7725 RepID=UPI00193A9BDF|nr:leucine-rich repeat-containing protein 47-like [Styela clava]
MSDWPEIAQCKEEKRRELVIKGTPDTRLKIEKNDNVLPEDLYSLTLLNFLEVSECGITSLSKDISSLSALMQLIINGNNLVSLPDEICTLKQLKVLDISYNALEELPDEFGNIRNLQTLNLNCNKLSQLPESVKNLSLLSTLNISNNKFTEIPQALIEGNQKHLADLKASHNQIEDVNDGIGTLEALKTLDLSVNKIKELPQTLANCFKLKSADYKDNPLKDRRLKKLIEQNNSSQKAIMDYIRTKGRPAGGENGSVGTGNKSGGKKKKKGKNAKVDVEEELIKHIIQVLKFGEVKKETKPLEITVSDEIKDVRPYIVCCVVKRLNLSKEGVFKKFIAIQTKLHDEVCGKRTIGTIASHDVSSLACSSLKYDAKEPDTFEIQPLGRGEQVSGLQLYKQLRAEADEMKKEKKRSQISGIYKYLSLLENQEKFAFLSRTSDDVVISLPPLTNSEISKIKMGKGDVLLEVTGSQSLSSCKTIMDKLLHSMLNEGMTSAKNQDFYDDSSDEEEVKNSTDPTKLIVQQVKIMDSQGKLKVVYPSRTDLEYQEAAIKVERF